MTDKQTITIKPNLVRFYDALMEMFPLEKSFVNARIAAKDQLDDTKLMALSMAYIWPDKTKIENKVDSYFLETNGFLRKINAPSAIFLKCMWANFDAEDKETVWSYFNTFVKSADKYSRN